MKEIKDLKKVRAITDINNADHPARQKAINILEKIAEYMGNETMFDCKDGNVSKNNDTIWYNLEDMVTNIIIEKG